MSILEKLSICEADLFAKGYSENVDHFFANFGQDVAAKTSMYEAVNYFEPRVNSHLDSISMQSVPYERRMAIGSLGIFGYFENLAQYETKISPRLLDMLRIAHSLGNIVKVSNIYTDKVNEQGGFPDGDGLIFASLPPNTTNSGKAFKRLRQVVTGFGSGPLSPDAVDERFGNIVQIYLDRMLVQK